jgi:hypothetical protein
MLPVTSIMDLLSTSRHTAKLNGRYISSAPGFAPAFLRKLEEVTKGAAFWKPKT